jgi:hypothetical protein
MVVVEGQNGLPDAAAVTIATEEDEDEAPDAGDKPAPKEGTEK